MSKDMEILLLKLNKVIIWLSIFLCSIYAVIYYISGDYFMLVSSIFVMVLPFLIPLFERKEKEIPLSIKTSYLLFVYIAAVIGAICGFYTSISSYDKIVHFISGIFTSWIFIKLIMPYYKKYDMRLILFNLICFVGMVALLWEIGEFTSDFILDQNFQNNLYDTMTDMIAGLVGGLIVALIYSLSNNNYKYKLAKK